MCYSALVKRNLEYLGRRYGAIVVREQVDEYTRASAIDPKKFPPLQDRIYPGHYAPVVFGHEGKRRVKLMRYGAYPPAHIQNPKSYTTFNARRDNLTSSFWSQAFMVHHGFVVLDGFYEWVAVKDLLQAGVVSLNLIKQKFERQTEERKAKVLSSGKKYKPTPTELKDPHFRQIIIEFKPEDEIEMIAPVIFSTSILEDGQVDHGFAIVTDDPPKEISSAGHDRCPVILEPDSIANWLDFKSQSAADIVKILGQNKRVLFQHRLAETA